LLNFLSGIDGKLFNLINKGCQNPAFDAVMPLLTELGSGLFLFILSILIILFRKKDNKRCGVLLLGGLTATYYIVYFLKHTVGRPRPYLSLPDVHTLIKESSFSFPSHHATDAFMAAVILTAFFKRRWVFFSLAVLVCFSRVYVGVHYVSDVAAGAVIGILIGYALLKISATYSGGKLSP